MILDIRYLIFDNLIFEHRMIDCRRQLPLRNSFMQKFIVQVHNYVSIVTNDKLSISCEGTDICDLCVKDLAQMLQAMDIFWRDGKHHALLGFGKPDFPRGKSGVL